MKTTAKNHVLLAFCFLVLPFISYGQVQIVLQPGPEEGKDAYINTFYGLRLDTTQSFIAAAWTYDGFEGVGRSFIQFNLPELPDDYSNFEAKINFHYDYSSHHEGHGGDNACKLERVIEYWTEEGVSWYNQPIVSETNAVILPASTTTDQDYLNIDVTQLVLDMYNDQDNSFGFRLSLLDETIYRSMILASSDHGDAKIRPSLVISYDTDTCSLPMNQYDIEINDLFCQFTYSDTTVTEWLWDFGNGYGSVLQNPAYTFPESGIYNVCLEVENSCGKIIICDTIIICEEMIPQFTYTVENLNVEFTNETLNGTSFFWDFGNGFFSYEENPEFQYQQTGSYLVCLTATNLCGSSVVCEMISEIKSEKVISEEEISNLIELYPNPTRDEVYFRIKDTKVHSIELYNNQGFFLKGINITGSQGDYRLPLLGHSSGLYIVKLNTDKGIITKRLLIQ